MNLTDEQLDTMQKHAWVLRNICGGENFGDGETPDVTHKWEDEDGRIFGSDEWSQGLSDAYMDAGTDVLVAGDCVLAYIPPHEGQSMPEVAKAIAAAGSDILALVAEVKRLRARPSPNGPRFIE